MIERRTRRRTRRDTRVGLIQIGVLAGTCLLIFFLDEIRRATEEGPRVAIVAEAAPGLQPGSAVWVAGRPVGRVLSVRLRPPEVDRGGRVIVRAVLHRSAEDVVREDATATIRASDLLEPMVVSVDPGSPSRPPFDFADTLRAVEDRVDQERVLALVDTLRRAGLEMSERFRSARRELRDRRGTLARLRDDPGLVDGLAANLRDAGALMEDFEGGVAGRVAADRSLAEAAGRLRERLARLSTPRDGRETLGTAISRLDALGERIARLSAALERGEGTAGRAIADRELSRQMALLRARLDSVMAELAADPGRWLRVRIF